MDNIVLKIIKPAAITVKKDGKAIFYCSNVRGYALYG